LGMERNIMTILVFDFLIAIAVGIAAAALMIFILVNVIVEWSKRS
jgi:hypothetical protein